MPLTTLTRRHFVHAGLLGSAAAALPALAATRPTVEAWKDPSCGCCKDWVAHMESNGFAATVHESGNSSVRARLGLPQRLGSCHTAVVQGYLLEGHVPAADVKRLLRDQPQALGLAVPGMPVGSPGMDGAVYNGRKDAYDVLLVKKAMRAGEITTEVYAHYS